MYASCEAMLEKYHNLKINWSVRTLIKKLGFLIWLTNYKGILFLFLQKAIVTVILLSILCLSETMYTYL